MKQELITTSEEKELHTKWVGGTFTDLLDVVFKIKNKTRNQQFEEFKEMLGDDEELVKIKDFITDFAIATENCKKSGRNEFRATLREKLEAMKEKQTL